MAKDEPVQPADEKPPAALNKFAALAAALGAAAEDEEAAQGAISEILKLIGDLPRADAQKLMARPEVFALVEEAVNAQKIPEGRKPGSPIYARIGGQDVKMGKVPWTWRDLDQFPNVTFTPNETLPITFSGLAVGLQAEVEVTLPSPFYDEYRRHKQALRDGEQWKNWFFNNTAPHPSPGTMSVDEVMAKAKMHKGMYVGGGGADRELMEHAAAQRPATVAETA